MLEPFRTRYFIAWLAVSVPLFVLTVAVVQVGTQAAGVSHTVTVALAVGAGTLFSDLIDPVLDWFLNAADGADGEDKEVQA